MARSAGAVAGVARGGIHAVEGLVEGAEFLRRYVTPRDWLLSPPGQSAPEQLYAAGIAGSQYVKDRIEDPSKIVADIVTGAQKMRVDLDPEATPVAPTFAAELRRNLDIGQNQGELAFNIGTFAIGGPWAKRLKDVGRLSKAESYEEALGRGLSHEAAEHLSQPYPASGMGHHNVPRRTKLPAILGGGPLPHAILDSPFNQLKPDSTRWEFIKLHSGVDAHLHGGRLPNGFREKGWSRRKLGFKRYNLAGRIWHGAPAPLKARIGGLGATLGGMIHSEPNEGR